jgi:acetyl coenzyme A synthetase (ADP forming)-like protein
MSIARMATKFAKPSNGETQTAKESLRPFFAPASVAVVGVSRDPARIGYRLLDAILRGHFRGRIFPVNPTLAEVAGLLTYPSVRDIPEPVDLAVIAVPCSAVLQVVDDCAARGVRALIVISAGFAEVGGEGKELQDRLKGKVTSYGMRLIGPNCLGMLATDPAVQLNATFVPCFPPRGRVAMSSDSGALGLAVLASADRLNLGLSSFVSVGNRADVSSNDLLEYWEDDPSTGAILLYLESFGNPRRFARIARQVSHRKPIVAVKAGRTNAGQRAAGSHTAALAARDVAVDAFFRQTGIIRADTLQEMFELIVLLDGQPLPSGKRVGILTNAGGPAILCADACEGGGLVVPEFSVQMQTKLATFLPRAASRGNPVDMIASASPEQYRQAMEAILASGEVDALIVIYVCPTLSGAELYTQTIRDAVAKARARALTDVPVVACLMPETTPRPLVVSEFERIPCYAFPEAAARSLSKAAFYAAWRDTPPGTLPSFDDVDVGLARRICRRSLETRGDSWLSAEDTRSVLRGAALPVLHGGVARTAREARTLASSLGFPVAVKLASSQILHKTEVGGVHLDLCSEAAVERAFDQIRARLIRENCLEAMEGVLVQPMIRGGTEVMVGVTQDPLFGPLLAFGLGGIHVEILGDVCLRVTPVTDRDAHEMVRAIRGHQLFEGYRGHPPADTTAVEEVLLRVSQLVEGVPEIRELDLNPIFAMLPGQGCRLVDARIFVAKSDGVSSEPMGIK